MVEGLSYRYRGSSDYALRAVSLAVEPGEFLVVAGPSGCGKSTLALALGGYLWRQHDGEGQGFVRVAGMDARTSPLYDVAEVVGLVQQNPEAQFCTLTVNDELSFGLENRCLPRGEIVERVGWALEVVGAAHLLDRELVNLSGGEKQKVAIAAILAARPRVLILDEPTSNLDPPATADLFKVIARIRARAGMTVLVIEHKVDYLLPFKPRLVVMDQGGIVYDGPFDELLLPPALEPCAPVAVPVMGEPLLRVQGLCAGYGGRTALHDVSLEVHPGEFLAIMGDNGSGKTTLLQSVLGLVKPMQGSVEVLGHDTRRTPVSSLAREVGLVFQNPDHQIFADTVWQEATFAPENLGLLDAQVEERVAALLARSGLGDRYHEHPYRLSYGQKRRLNLVSVLSSQPRLLLLDEMLIGQDSANAVFLLGLLAEHARQGGAVLLVSHVPEVARCYANRLLFLEAGRLLQDSPPVEAFDWLATRGQGAYLPAARSMPGPRPIVALLPAPQTAVQQRSGRTRSRITYQPGSSIFHRLHPLVKLLWLLLGTVGVFAVQSPWPVVAAVCLLLLALPLAGVRLAGLRGTRLLASTALLLGLLQVLFVHEGKILFEVGPLTIWQGGVEAGFYVAGRFLSVVLLSYLFVLTTDPNDLAYALMRAGLPYRYGFALITALRLVPVFEQEGQTVYNAQLARGVQYDVRSPRRFLALARQFFLPLLVSALGKVDSLAVSMEGRCFGKHPTRTFVREVRAGWPDVVALGVLAVLVGLMVAVSAFWQRGGGV